MKYLLPLFFSTSLFAQTVPDAIRIITQGVSPSANECPSLVSCSQQFIGSDRKNPPAICNSNTNNPEAFLARYPDGTVVVNQAAVDEAMNYREDDEAAGSSGRRQPAGNRRTPPRSRRGTDPELNRMISNVSTNPSVIQSMNASLDLLKAQLREQVSQGVPPEQQSAQQRFLLNKLDRLQVTFEFGEECQQFPFNASYSGVLNTLNMCPLLTNLAPASYLPLLAHELGHMIDPCSFFDNHRFNPEIAALSNNENAQKASLTTKINRCLTDVTPAEKRRFTEWATSPSRMANQGLTIYRHEPDTGGNREIVEKLQRCGVVQAPENPAPLTYEGTPYLPILSCVSQNYSVSHGAIAAGTRISSATCNRETKMAETIADYVSSTLTARILNRNPAAIPSNRGVHLPNFFSSVVCGNDNDPMYLTGEERMNLFLNPAVTQTAVGCDPAGLRPVCPLPASLTGDQ